ncbi:hypothetical protein EAE96_007791 [Botrytis aclada]|nr:hypothetical protein EAE96_007791 [Botrytis aclada]
MTSYSWYNATAIARRTRLTSADNNSSMLHTIFIVLGAWIIFGILDNITPLWKAIGLQPGPQEYEPLDTQEFATSGGYYEDINEIPLPLMTPAVPRRTPRGISAKKVQNLETPMTPTTLRRSSRVRELVARNGLPTPVATPTTPMNSAKGKGKGKGKSIKNASLDDFFEPIPTPTGQKKVIKGREKQIVLDEYEAFMNEPEEKRVKKAATEDDFDHEGYSTPWTATRRKNVRNGKLMKTPKVKGKKNGNF